MHEMARFYGGVGGCRALWCGRRFRAWLCHHRARNILTYAKVCSGLRPLDFAPFIKNRSPGQREEEMGAGKGEGGPPSSGGAIAVQLSKSTAGYGKPAETQPGYVRPDKIFLLFPLPVKATTRGDNQERQGGVTTRRDKNAPRRFFKKK